MADISSQINELIENEVAAQVAAQTAKYKTALQEAIGILQAVASEPDANNDLAGRCAVCEKPFIKKDASSEFCDGCRDSQAPKKPAEVSTPKKISQVVEKPVKSDPPQSATLPSKISEKICAACGDPFTTAAAQTKYCRQPDCEKQRVSDKKSKDNKSHLDEPVGARHEDKIANTHPVTPDSVTHYQTMPGGTGRRFTDPWDCQACRDYEQPCKLHKALEADGKRPPSGKPPAVIGSF